MSETSRQLEILELLQTHGECAVERLARECAVSDMTIRRDLQVLADAGRVLRTHGGAMPAEQVMFHFDFLRRTELHAEGKHQIATAAARLVKDGQTVMLDSGTTTLALAKQLRTHRRLTLITTSLPIASVLQSAPGIDVLLLGGFLRRGSPDLGGALTESNLETLHADIAFIGADGIDLKGNIYNHSLEIGRMLGKMATAADQVYVVADSSKLGHPAMARFGQLRQWRGLITDAGISETQRASLRKAGAHLIITQSKES